MSKLDRELTNWKEMYDQVHTEDEQLDEAVDLGFHQATKRPTRRLRKFAWPVLTAVAALFLLFGGVRVSSAFAEKVSQVPGMENIVQLIQGDKSKQAAIDADHFQPLGITEEKGDLTLSLEGVIRDDYGMVIFYTLEAVGEHRNLRLGTPKLTTGAGEELPPKSVSYNGRELEENKDMQMMEVYTQEGMGGIENFHLSISGSGIIDGSFVKEEFAVSFTAKNDAQSKEYTLEETVSIEGEQFVIENVTIHPLRTAIKVREHPENETELLSIEDLELKGENGEVWSGVNNGVTASGGPENDEMTFYIQSNYFEQPESLALTFSKVMVADQEKEYMEIDLESEKILYQPGEIAELTEASTSAFEMKFDEEVSQNIGFSSVKDEKGDTLHPSSQQVHSLVEGPKTVHTFFDEAVKGPIRIDFSSYPHWLEKEIKIPLE
ncbi:DUF4179 domain-containing protein [Halobacillus aidingensis]|uniref:DUF4179 domain-containing protein n=1 Tax=Halobacillus aidingensis TaxID=240303 RepID=A0A1H0RJS9_HALAD|nr:DUF4179 domain-containing protein [Halobacillus aidingensis]SDP29797.1 protein of unknown function [Halobacillus aidingensis]